MRAVIIGGVAAGMSAASKIKRERPEAEVEVYTAEEYISYASCGLPYYVENLVKNKEDLIARTLAEFEEQGIKVFTGNRVVKLLPDEKKVLIRNQDGDEFEREYDKLVIATGSVSVIPDFPGVELDNVFSVKTIPDGENIKAAIAANKPKSAVIVGGGYIGLEMAEALKELGLAVTVIQHSDQLVTNIDADMAAIIEDYMIKQGIIIRKNESVLALEGNEKVERVKTDQGIIETELVVIAVGVRPSSELAAEAGIELGPKGAIKVNSKMETNLPDIYAAGDCATAYHMLYEDDTYIPLGTTANKQGRIAGENVLGWGSEFGGIIGTAITKVMDIELGRTGLAKKEADMLGKDVVEVTIAAPGKAHYYPGAGEANVKLIIEKGSNKILGGTIVGAPGSAKRIDVIATCIHAGMTVQEMARLDLSYAPPFSPVWEPLLVAANAAVSKISKMK